MAGVRMAQEKPGHTLQPRALVHEAWLLLAADGLGWPRLGCLFGRSGAGGLSEAMDCKIFGAFAERITLNL